MALNSNLHGSSTGLPLCLSGITTHLGFSREIADHDRRRKVFKKMKIVGVGVRDRSIGTQRSHENIVVDEDLAGVLRDLPLISPAACTAKAA